MKVALEVRYSLIVNEAFLMAYESHSMPLHDSPDSTSVCATEAGWAG
jgi:hypothetical protein